MATPPASDLDTTTDATITMKDLDPHHNFLAVLVEQRPNGLFLHQHQYIQDIFEGTGMSNCKPCSTLVDTWAKVFSVMGTTVSDLTAYRSLVRALQYLTFTRPNISYTVQ
jgi:hypothetical protein